MKHFLILLVSWVGCSYAQLANQPPTPQWLGRAAGAPQSAVTMELRFEQHGTLLKAILLLAADNKAQVRVNGRPLSKADPTTTEAALSLDLTSLIKEGANVLSITTESARMAALLELNGDLARVRWIPTDDRWTSPNGNLVVLGPVGGDREQNPFDLKKSFDAYNSWQLAKPSAQSQATDPNGADLAGAMDKF